MVLQGGCSHFAHTANMIAVVDTKSLAVTKRIISRLAVCMMRMCRLGHGAHRLVIST